MQEITLPEQPKKRTKKEEKRPTLINKKESYITPKARGGKPSIPWEERFVDNSWENFGEEAASNDDIEPGVTLMSLDEIQEKKLEALMEDLFEYDKYIDELYERDKERSEEKYDDNILDTLPQEKRPIINETNPLEKNPHRIEGLYPLHRTTREKENWKSKEPRTMPHHKEAFHKRYTKMKTNQFPKDNMKTISESKFERQTRDKIRTFLHNNMTADSDFLEKYYGYDDQFGEDIFLNAFIAHYFQEEDTIKKRPMTEAQWEEQEKGELREQIHNYTKWLKTRPKEKGTEEFKW